MRRLLVAAALLVACGEDAGDPASQGGADTGAGAEAGPADAVPGDDGAPIDQGVGPVPDGASTDRDGAPPLGDGGIVDLDGGPGCPRGTACNPEVVDVFPAERSGDTRTAPASDWDAYACAPDTGEAGSEVVYRLDIAQRGLLTVTVDDVAGDDVDIDVHLLSDADPDLCLARDNRVVSRVVDPGSYSIAADTYSGGGGADHAGPFVLSFTLDPVVGGNCAMMPVDLAMFWDDCDPGLDCFEGPDPQTGATRRFLRTPAVGPVALEAHLVTDADGFGDAWPGAIREGIAQHYAVSQEATGYDMARDQPWAPAGEGGSEFGQGSFGRPLPVEDEAWYVNMYWRARPTPGTRMLVMNPENGRAVVTAAGYETGPYANDHIGGACEEIHDWLGSGHSSTLMMGFLADQDLPLGPIECDP